MALTACARVVSRWLACAVDTAEGDADPPLGNPKQLPPAGAPSSSIESPNVSPDKPKTNGWVNGHNATDPPPSATPASPAVLGEVITGDEVMPMNES